MKVDIRNRFILYSKNKEGQVITHRMMIDPDTKEGQQKLQKYYSRGFVREIPEEWKVKTEDVTIGGNTSEIDVAKDHLNEATKVLEEHIVYAGENVCPDCGFQARSAYGLVVHQRNCKKKNG